MRKGNCRFFAPNVWALFYVLHTNVITVKEFILWQGKFKLGEQTFFHFFIHFQKYTLFFFPPLLLFKTLRLLEFGPGF